MSTSSSPGMMSKDEALLWQAFVSDRKPEQRRVLINKYLSLAKKIASKQYIKRYSDDVDFEDYYQYGVIGLIEAVDRYQPGKGAAFETYATYRISGSIINNLKHLTERREQNAYRNRTIRERVESLSVQEAPTLLDELIDIAVGLAVGYMLDGTSLLQEKDAVSLDTPYRESTLAELRENIEAAINKVLSEKEQVVILYHYGHELTFELIADSLGITKGRVSQIHKKAIEKLRNEIAVDASEYYV